MADELSSKFFQTKANIRAKSDFAEVYENFDEEQLLATITKSA